jgi:hypothetical protein
LTADGWFGYYKCLSIFGVFLTVVRVARNGIDGSEPHITPDTGSPCPQAFSACVRIGEETKPALHE